MPTADFMVSDKVTAIPINGAWVHVTVFLTDAYGQTAKERDLYGQTNAFGQVQITGIPNDIPLTDLKFVWSYDVAATGYVPVVDNTKRKGDQHIAVQMQLAPYVEDYKTWHIYFLPWTLPHSTYFATNTDGSVTSPSFTDEPSLKSWIDNYSSSPPTCPVGQHWDSSKNACVANPPVDTSSMGMIAVIVGIVIFAVLLVFSGGKRK
jgi:hypothetical protein